MSNVKIGPNFFAKAKNDYINWRFALAREFLQNSIDACRNTKMPQINIEIKNVKLENCTYTTLTVEDNGCGMDKDTLTNKLLSLGESDKNFDGTVGGFGKAKEILYFCHKNYTIKSQTNGVHGSGAEYFIEEIEHRQGTLSSIDIHGTYCDELIRAFRQVISQSQWHGTFVLNNEVLRADLKKGALRKELPWCRVYTNKSFSNQMIVRIGGVVMFTRHIDGDRCVLVELEGSSEELLQSSRDVLKYQYSRELDALIRRITVDRKSAFRPENPEYDYWSGQDFNQKVSASSATEEVVLSATEEVVQEYSEHLPTKCFDHSFVVKNSLGVKIPDYYIPGQFSDYSKKLVKYWGKLCLTCHKLFERDGQFQIGFIFEENIEAEYEKNGDKVTFYINPVKVVNGALKRRWGFTWDLKYKLIVTAVHEFVHSLGFDVHNEHFTSAMDKHLSIVMKELKRFRSCFD